MSHDMEKVAYLQEHLPYELLMLRYTLKKIVAPQLRLDWNVYFESFAVHARNLYDFLTNSEDSRNFKAKDFVAYFSISKEDKVISMFTRLHSQVFHLPKNRPTDQAKKANADRAKLVSRWIETNFATFISGLGADYGSKWHGEDADPSKIIHDGVMMLHCQTASTATNFIMITTTGDYG